MNSINLSDVYYIKKELQRKKLFKQRSYVKNKNLYVFVYGTLKSGFSNHSFLRTSEFIAKGKTKTKYGFSSNGIYPTVLLDAPNKKKLNIYGEVYKVDTQTLDKLDLLEVGYKRIFTTIMLADGNEIDAYIYVNTSSIPASDKYLTIGSWY